MTAVVVDTEDLHLAHSGHVRSRRRQRPGPDPASSHDPAAASSSSDSGDPMPGPHRTGRVRQQRRPCILSPH